VGGTGGARGKGRPHITNPKPYLSIYLSICLYLSISIYLYISSPNSQHRRNTHRYARCSTPSPPAASERVRSAMWRDGRNTLHHEPCTLNPAPCTLNSRPFTCGIGAGAERDVGGTGGARGRGRPYITNPKPYLSIYLSIYLYVSISIYLYMSSPNSQHRRNEHRCSAPTPPASSERVRSAMWRDGRSTLDPAP